MAKRKDICRGSWGMAIQELKRVEKDQDGSHKLTPWGQRVLVEQVAAANKRERTKDATLINCLLQTNKYKQNLKELKSYTHTHTKTQQEL